MKDYVDNAIARKLCGKLIKFAKESFYDVPVDWTDEQINNKIWWLREYPYGPTIWCHYDEQLFDHPYICKENYVEKPIPEGKKRVRVAQQHTRYIKLDWFLWRGTVEEVITDHIRCFGLTDSPRFIWCWGDEELFKE